MATPTQTKVGATPGQSPTRTNPSDRPGLLQDTGLVFTMPDGSQVHPEAFSKVFERRVRAWKFATLTVHGLRHSWATAALECGVHPRVVHERLGHSSIAVTLGL